jgi:hypothetical protein
MKTKKQRTKKTYQFFAEGQTSDGVSVLVERRRVDADAHRVGQHHHHCACFTRLAWKTVLQRKVLEHV